MEYEKISQLYNLLSDFQQENTPCGNGDYSVCNQSCNFYDSGNYGSSCVIDTVLHELDSIIMSKKINGGTL